MSLNDQLNAIEACKVQRRLAADVQLRRLNFNRRHVWLNRNGLVVMRRYQGSLEPRPLIANVVGHSSRPAASLASYSSGITFNGTRVYWVFLETFARMGPIAPIVDYLTQAVIYESGSYEGPVPNVCTDLRAEQRANRKFRLTWLYNPMGEQVAPEEFEVYHDNGTGTLDLGTPIGTVTYQPEEEFYELLTDAYTAGQTIAFSVRAKSAAGHFGLQPGQGRGYTGPSTEPSDVTVGASTLQAHVISRTVDTPEAPIIA